jgi:hypothetical protein
VPVKWFFAYIHKKSPLLVLGALENYFSSVHHRPARPSGFCPDRLDHTVATVSFIELSIPLLRFIYHFKENHA